MQGNLQKVPPISIGIPQFLFDYHDSYYDNPDQNDDDYWTNGVLKVPGSPLGHTAQTLQLNRKKMFHHWPLILLSLSFAFPPQLTSCIITLHCVIIDQLDADIIIMLRQEAAWPEGCLQQPAGVKIFNTFFPNSPLLFSFAGVKSFFPTFFSNSPFFSFPSFSYLLLHSNSSYSSLFFSS